MKIRENVEKHVPCKHRKRENRDGVTLDWCYAIGCCELGDMPCEYCKDVVREAEKRSMRLDVEHRQNRKCHLICKR